MEGQPSSTNTLRLLDALQKNVCVFVSNVLNEGTMHACMCVLFFSPFFRIESPAGIKVGCPAARRYSAVFHILLEHTHNFLPLMLDASRLIPADPETVSRTHSKIRWKDLPTTTCCVCVFMCVQTHTTYKSGSQKIEEGPHIREAIEGCPWNRVRLHCTWDG
jgi:hypothetical protein